MKNYYSRGTIVEIIYSMGTNEILAGEAIVATNIGQRRLRFKIRNHEICNALSEGDRVRLDYKVRNGAYWPSRIRKL